MSTYTCHGMWSVCERGVMVMNMIMNMFVCILLQCAGGWAGKGEVRYAM